MTELNGRLRRYPAEELGERMLSHGRIALTPLPRFYWTGSGVTLAVRASELWIELDAAWERQEDAVRVTVNGYTALRVIPEPGRSRFCVYRNLSAETVHTVRLWKETQPSGEAGHHLSLAAVYTDGELLPPPRPRYRFEFIGDSLTSGEGLAGDRSEGVWCPFVFSSEGHYAYLVGEEMDASVSVVALSGHGYACGFTGDPRQTILPLYGKTGGRASDPAGLAPYDIESDRNDLVVINLGANDFGATRRPIFTDPETGESFVMQKGEDGRLLPESRKALLSAILALCHRVRLGSPRARILLLSGMNGENPELHEILGDALRQIGGDAARLAVPPCLPEQRGSRSHPGPAAHRAVADAIVAYLRENPLP